MIVPRIGVAITYEIILSITQIGIKFIRHAKRQLGCIQVIDLHLLRMGCRFGEILKLFYPERFLAQNPGSVLHMQLSSRIGPQDIRNTTLHSKILINGSNFV
jgi:hypothetical protein